MDVVSSNQYIGLFAFCLGILFENVIPFFLEMVKVLRYVLFKRQEPMSSHARSQGFSSICTSTTRRQFLSTHVGVFQHIFDAVLFSSSIIFAASSVLIRSLGVANIGSESSSFQ